MIGTLQLTTLAIIVNEGTSGNMETRLERKNIRSYFKIFEVDRAVSKLQRNQ